MVEIRGVPGYGEGRPIPQLMVLKEKMNGLSNRYDIDHTDYDGGNEKRWYYTVYSDREGQWFWEPRLPSEAELAAPHAIAGVSWEPTIVRDAEWPLRTVQGPYVHRGEAIGAAEAWFDSRS
jgi:hypothetical protein